MTRSDKPRERELFRGLVDGTLTPEEFAAVEERLLADPGFRERYVRAIAIEGHLYEAFSFPGTFREPATPPKSSFRVRAWAFIATCALVLLGSAAWIYWAPATPRRNRDLAAGLLPEQKPVAIVTRVNQIDEAAAARLRPGTRIKPGVLSVASGQVQIEFHNGALINLEGPAELRVLSVDAANLLSGKAAVRIPPGARGFVLNTPEAAIVDLGTEFAVSVGKRGESELHVVDGEVDVSLLGRDGNTLISQRVSEAKSLRMSRDAALLESIDTPSVALPGIHAPVSVPLSVPQGYIQSVRASRPEIYWRFENLVDGRVPNEIGPRWPGVIRDASAAQPAIVLRDGVAHFTPSAKPRHIEPEQPIPGLNHDAFSIEFWVSPDNFHWATLVAIVPEETSSRNMHLSLVELPYKCSLVYTPGSFRFLHRHPPGDHGGFNLFTDGDCTPGLWHHVVAVKTPQDLRLFLNGRLCRRVEEPTTCDDESYRFLVGELYDSGSRQLSGAIDEFAIYLRALDDDEVAEHYRSMMPTSPN